MDQPLNIKAAADGEHNREAVRDSLLLIATLRRAGGTEHHVRVRNLSAGGMMADSAIDLARGDHVEVELRNIGTIGGRVAWSDGERLGVAFDVVIDPKIARKRLGKGPDVPLRRPTLWNAR